MFLTCAIYLPSNGVGMLNNNIVTIDVHKKEVAEFDIRNYNSEVKIDLSSKFGMDTAHFYVIDGLENKVWAINRETLKIEWHKNFDSRPISLKVNYNIVCVHCMDKSLTVFKKAI